jgi:cytochrome P450
MLSWEDSAAPAAVPGARSASPAGEQPMTNLFTFEQKQLPWFCSMRATAPVHFCEQENAWELFRYDDIVQVLANHEQFSSDFPQNGEFRRPLGRTMISSDPPLHSQLRGLVARDFTPRAVAQLTPRINAIAQELLDRVAQRGSMDIVKEFADPLPVIVIAELIGIPAQ